MRGNQSKQRSTFTPGRRNSIKMITGSRHVPETRAKITSYGRSRLFRQRYFRVCSVENSSFKRISCKWIPRGWERKMIWGEKKYEKREEKHGGGWRRKGWEGGGEIGESGVWNLTVIRIVGMRRFPSGASTICKNIGHPVDVAGVLVIFAWKPWENDFVSLLKSVQNRFFLDVNWNTNRSRFRSE